MFVPKILTPFSAAGPSIAFPLFQYDSPGDLYIGTSPQPADVSAHSRDANTSAVWTARSVTIFNVGAIPGVFSASIQGGYDFSEEILIRLEDNTNAPKLWRDQCIRIQAFGAGGASNVTIGHDIGVTHPPADLAAVGGSIPDAEKLAVASETWRSSSVDGIPAPTTSSVISVANLGAGTNNAVSYLRGRTIVFLTGNVAQVQSIVMDFVQSSRLLTFKEIEIAPVAGDQFVII